MKSIIIESDVKEQLSFADIFRAELPQYNILLTLDHSELNNIEYIVIWKEYPTYINKLPNLKAILTCGSGVDHLITQIEYLKYIPLIRIVDPFLKVHVIDYVNKTILNHYRELLNVKNKNTEFNNKNIKVGVMGFGQIGKFLTLDLQNNGFQVRALANGPKNHDGIDVWCAQEDLKNFLCDLNIIICILPLTEKTRGILNINMFENLNPQCYLINIGRSGHLIDEDLIKALKNNLILGACLDVIDPDSQLHMLSEIEKSQLNIKLTPHVAGYISAKTQAPEAVLKIKELESGLLPLTVVSIENQY